MTLVHVGKAATWPDAQRIAATLRKVWTRPAFMVRVSSRYVGANTWDREYIIRLYRRN